MTNISINPSVKIVNGKVTTTSLRISEHFVKRHDHVLRAIENLECSEDFRALNFGESSFDVPMPNGGARKQLFYNVTKDGFMFLVMGFTGKEAAKWKEAYIAAFNKLEAAQNKTVPALRPPLTNQQALDRMFRHSRYLIAVENGEVTPILTLKDDDMVMSVAKLPLVIRDAHLSDAQLEAVALACIDKNGNVLKAVVARALDKVIGGKA